MTFRNLHALHDTQDGGLTVIDDRSGLRVSFIRGGTDEHPLLIMETYCFDRGKLPVIDTMVGRYAATSHVVHAIRSEERP